ALCFLASQMSAKDFFVGAQSRGITCGIVFAPDEALENEHYVARRYPTTVDHPELDRSFVYPGVPLKGSEIPRRIRRAPLVGEHTNEVLAALPDTPAPK